MVVKQGDRERRIPARTKVWAAGVQASPLAQMSGEATGADVDRAGRVSVLPDCTLPGHPEVFAIGDMMSLDTLPGVAEVAMQHDGAEPGDRRHAAEVPVAERLRLLPRRRRVIVLEAWSPGFKGIRLSGLPGWLAWLFVHLTFLTGFKNRLATIPAGRSRSSATGGPIGERSVWGVGIPVSERVVLDSEKFPTGELEEADLPAGPLGARTFDDEFAPPDGPFVLEEGGGGLRSRLARATPTHRSTRRTTTT